MTATIQGKISVVALTIGLEMAEMSAAIARQTTSMSAAIDRQTAAMNAGFREIIRFVFSLKFVM